MFNSTRCNVYGLILIALGISLHSLPQAAVAAPQFTALLRDNVSGGGPGTSGPAPVDTGHRACCGDMGYCCFAGDAFGRAAAGRGLLRARMFTSAQVFNGTTSKDFEARSSFILNDLIISAPPEITTVITSLHIRVDGDMDFNMPMFAGSTAGIRLSTHFGNGASDSAYYIGSFQNATGLFAGGTGNSIHADFTTPPATVETNHFIDMNISLTAYSSTGTGSGPDQGQFATATSNFFDQGISLPVGGPVFDLPDGFTANSADGLIVDNHWIPGCPGRKGDFDNDDAVTPLDIADFVNNLLDGPSDATAACKTDMNVDTLSDAGDIAPFVGCLTGGACP